MSNGNIELDLFLDEELAADGEEVELFWSLKKPKSPTGLTAVLRRQDGSEVDPIPLPKGNRKETVAFAGASPLSWTLLIRSTGAPAGTAALFQRQVSLSRAPPTPQWLTRNHTFSNGNPITFEGGNVTGTQFKSFGQRFSANAPANRTLAQKLVAAEIRAYRQYAITTRALTVSGDVEDPAYEADYYHWLGICFTHIGFRNATPTNPQGKHASGSALDMNFDSNPWFPVRHANNNFGGEKHSAVPADRHQELIWDPAWEACDVAMEFWFGAGSKVFMPGFDPAPENNKTGLPALYDLHARVSFALKGYFQITMKPAIPEPQAQRTAAVLERLIRLERQGTLTPDEQAEKARLAALASVTGGSGAKLTRGSVSSSAPAPVVPACRHRTFDEFTSEMLDWVRRGQVPKAFELFNPFDKDTDDTRKKLKSFHDRAPRLHDQCRPAMVRGSCTFSGGVVGMPEGTRDPCNGFLDIRKEIVVAIATRLQGTQCVRWGGCNFGGDDGDRQHFDLGSNVRP
jgi:hypothetical protein